MAAFLKEYLEVVRVVVCGGRFGHRAVVGKLPLAQAPKAPHAPPREPPPAKRRPKCNV